MEDPPSGEISGIIDGSADEVAPAASKIIRVFLSSTFSGNSTFSSRQPLFQAIGEKLFVSSKARFK